MNQESSPKLCECGCGEPTKIAATADKRSGYVAGEPLRFIHGHNSRLQTAGIANKYRVLANGCWEWIGNRNEAGYGIFGDSLAHRVMWTRATGLVAPPQLDHLCHDRATCGGGKTCPHRRCVNPAHLKPVLPVINSQRGCKTKLTADQVRAIRRDTRTQTVIAGEYGVSVGYVSRLKAGYHWRNVT